MHIESEKNKIQPCAQPYFKAKHRLCQEIILFLWEASIFVQIADDPIVSCMERWGMPPWLAYGGAFEDEMEDEDDDI